jgi:putative peptidoglycan lipid II flippase
MSPIAIGIIFSHISGIIDNMLASMLDTGSVSYLGYSKKIIDAIILIGPVAIMTVVYSQLCHLASQEKWYDFKKLFAKALTLILCISLPASFVIIFLVGLLSKCFSSTEDSLLYRPLEHRMLYLCTLSASRHCLLKA